MSFEWKASEGKLNGNKTTMVFYGETAGIAVITCTINHPGKTSVTKNITIVVE
jgi:hypothetical protein